MLSSLIVLLFGQNFVDSLLLLNAALLVLVLLGERVRDALQTQVVIAALSAHFLRLFVGQPSQRLNIRLSRVS